MLGPFSRTELLIGGEAMEKLKNATIAIFGIGGVGTYAVEGLARCGVGKLVLVDDDNICLTNINRQLHATMKTIGKSKVEAMAERVREISPKTEVVALHEVYKAETADRLLSEEYDYVIDAIDTISAKLDMVVRCNQMGIPIISCMGAGNKLDPTAFEVSDIYKTSVCPLAKVMRNELKKLHVKKLKVVYSKELPIKPKESDHLSCKNNCICPPGSERTCTSRRAIPGSISFVPSVAGLILAGEVIKDLIQE